LEVKNQVKVILGTIEDFLKGRKSDFSTPGSIEELELMEGVLKLLTWRNSWTLAELEKLKTL
jgi:hypothetical protein